MRDIPIYRKNLLLKNRSVYTNVRFVDYLKSNKIILYIIAFFLQHVSNKQFCIAGDNYRIDSIRGRAFMNTLFERLSEHISNHKSQTSRRQFIRASAVLIGTLGAFKGLIPFAWAGQKKQLMPRSKRMPKTLCDLAVVKGESPALITRKAIEALGGMGRFVRKGDIVVVKPNIGWDRAPEYAATTNPEVTAELVRLCLGAGARKVKVFDNTCNHAAMCYKTSRIAEAVTKAGGHISYIANSKFFPGQFPAGSAMEDWPIYLDAAECDCFINVPVAKHHSLSGLTLSMKNLMGVCGGTRGMIHWNMDKKLPELTKFINPDLTIIDAYRILLRHGPTGGSLEDVKTTKTIIAATDPVLADSYAATLFNVNPKEIGHIHNAEKFGLGTTNIAKANIQKIFI